MRARPIDPTLGANAPQAGAEGPAPEGTGRVRELLEELARAPTEEARSVALEKLHQIAPERTAGSRRAGDAVEEINSALRDAALDVPAPADAGLVSVRVTGIDEDMSSVPLSELRVRVSSGDKSVEGKTDTTGHALLNLGAAGSAGVELLSPKGEVIERAEVRLSREQSASVALSVKRRPDLEDSFARGRAWSEEVKRRAEEIGAGSLSNTGALEQRVAAIESTLSRLEQAITALVKERTKGDDHE